MGLKNHWMFCRCSLKEQVLLSTNVRASFSSLDGPRNVVSVDAAECFGSSPSRCKMVYCTDE